MDGGRISGGSEEAVRLISGFRQCGLIAVQKEKGNQKECRQVRIHTVKDKIKKNPYRKTSDW